ncbi:MAG: division/cell wall cluster transcriptional repressor MraZ [Verrucomicrobia bacterium]|jgi:MraZ protein|nr:division/cell wall cluster transcriptional repressor MraZ [Verrucomicrobiota bacterium]
MAQLGKPFYTGLFRHTLDDKNRLTIPSAWRSAHGESDTFLATPHPDGYVAVLPPVEVEKLHAKIAAMALSDRDAQDVAARFFAATHAFTFDKQGRIGLTDELRKHAGIDKDAVLVGSLTKFNLYSPDRWNRVEQRTAGENFGDLMRRMGI